MNYAKAVANIKFIKIKKTILTGFLAPGTHFSYSVETIPSAPPELRENHYDTSNVVHQVAGTRDTCQGSGTEPLQYGQGSSHGIVCRVNCN